MVGMGMMEVIIILIVLFALFMLVAAGVVVAVLVLRKKPNSVEGTQAMPGVQQPAFGAAPAVGPGPAAPRPAKDPNHARTLAAPDYTFAKISQSMQQIGFSLQGGPGAEVAPGEPGSATFSKGAVTATYNYDPSCQLRMIDLSGPNARYSLNDLLNDAYMPTLEGYKVSGLLSSSDPTELYRGIRAAEFIGIGGDVRFYIDPVGNLLSHANPNIAAEARRVHAVLSSRQAGG